MKNKLWGLISSSIPLSTVTEINIITLSSYLDISEDNIDKVKNREVKTALYDKLKIIPGDNIEFLRYLLFKLTKKTLLIKDLETVYALKASNKTLALKILNAYEEQYSLIPLSEIFNRYKPLFIALKTSDNYIRFRIGKEEVVSQKRKPSEIKLNALMI